MESEKINLAFGEKVENDRVHLRFCEECEGKIEP